jgi:hypothetical protein
MGDRSAGKRGFTSHRADPASQWAASSAPFDDRCGSGCGVAGDNGVPGGVDGDGVGSPSAEITVCAPVLVSMAITVLSSGWPRRRFKHRRPPPRPLGIFPTGIVVAAWVPGSIMHGVVVGAAEISRATDGIDGRRRRLRSPLADPQTDSARTTGTFQRRPDLRIWPKLHVDCRRRHRSAQQPARRGQRQRMSLNTPTPRPSWCCATRFNHAVFASQTRARHHGP